MRLQIHMHIYIYICMHICICANICAWVCAYIYRNVYLLVYSFIYLCVGLDFARPNLGPRRLLLLSCARCPGSSLKDSARRKHFSLHQVGSASAERQACGALKGYRGCTEQGTGSVLVYMGRGKMLVVQHILNRSFGQTEVVVASD